MEYIACKYLLKTNLVSYHYIAYPVPHAHSDILHKEIDILCKVVVMNEFNQFDWGVLNFIQPNNNKTRVY